MLFNSHIFLLIFLPIVLFCFHHVAPAARLHVLLTGSLIFYGWDEWKPLLFMLLVIAFVYGATALSASWKPALRKTIVATGPLTVLVLFRYLNFICDNLGL